MIDRFKKTEALRDNKAVLAVIAVVFIVAIVVVAS